MRKPLSNIQENINIIRSILTKIELDENDGEQHSERVFKIRLAQIRAQTRKMEGDSNNP